MYMYMYLISYNIKALIKQYLLHDRTFNSYPALL